MAGLNRRAFAHRHYRRRPPALMRLAAPWLAAGALKKTRQVFLKHHNVA